MSFTYEPSSEPIHMSTLIPKPYTRKQGAVPFVADRKKAMVAEVK